MEVLFKTVHGSRLYGLSNENSDEDFYTVIRKQPFRKGSKARYAKQKIVGNVDSMVLDFGTWVEMCRSGTPQALEAIFSTMVIEDSIEEFRLSYRAGTEVYDTYFRTIKSFALSEDSSTKKRKHALRLALNLNELAKTGRFNPTLSKEDAEWVTKMATKSHEDVYGLALCTAW